MIPTIGRIVHYRLTRADAERANQLGGNTYAEGDIAPLVIVRVWGTTATSAFNGRLLLDGPGTPLWITSTCIGDQVAQCAWPPRA